MMTFSEQFAQSQGKPIECDGQVVHAIYRHEAKTGLKLRLRWVSGVDSPAQGVSISVKGGLLEVADTKAKDIVLWRDTAPSEVTIKCSGRGVREILVWNCWRDDRGITRAWIGNAGMQLDDTGANTVRARCNSRSVVTFGDLVFDLVFEEP